MDSINILSFRGELFYSKSISKLENKAKELLKMEIKNNEWDDYKNINEVWRAVNNDKDEIVTIYKKELI